MRVVFPAQHLNQSVSCASSPPFSCAPLQGGLSCAPEQTRAHLRDDVKEEREHAEENVSSLVLRFETDQKRLDNRQTLQRSKA